MTVHRLLLAAAGFGGVTLIAASASAASPAYCALYAREYAIDAVQPAAASGMLQSVQDQAYYRCLNQDEDPPLPQTSAYYGTDLSDAVKVATASAPPGDTASTVAEPAASPAKPAAPAPAPAATIVTASAAKPYRGSGMTAWTPEWKAWCAENFPHSWDPATGTIQHYQSDTRELCK